MNTFLANTPEKKERPKNRSDAPRLSPVQLAAISERKNTVNGRYVAAYNAQQALRKMYPQLDVPAVSPHQPSVTTTEVQVAPKYVPAPEVAPPTVPTQLQSTEQAPIWTAENNNSAAVQPLQTNDQYLRQARYAVEQSYFDAAPDLPAQLAEHRPNTQPTDTSLPYDYREAA